MLPYSDFTSETFRNVPNPNRFILSSEAKAESKQG